MILYNTLIINKWRNIGEIVINAYIKMKEES